MNYKRRQQMRRRTGWIYVRYLFPLLMILLILIAMRIPCLQYTTADTGTNDTISTWELLANSFEQSREILFGTEEQTQTNVSFSRTVLITLIVCTLLFLVGCTVAVWSAVAAFRYARDPKEVNTARIAFITLVPNRTVLCLWLLCLLPLPAFPRLLVLIYQAMMNYAVALDVTFAEPLIIALALWLIHLILSAATANAERELHLDPFQRLKPKEAEEETEQENEKLSPSNASEQESILMSKTREEQLAQIRRMLGDEKDDRDAN